MLPGGIGIPRRIGVERHGGQRLVVVTGALRDVESFIRLGIDPRSGHVVTMRFLAQGHIMYSHYDGFVPARGPPPRGSGRESSTTAQGCGLACRCDGRRTHVDPRG
jgi:hypothetical protein